MRQLIMLMPYCWVVLMCLSSCVIQPDVTPPRISSELVQCQERPNRFISYDNAMMLDTCTQLLWMIRDYRNIEGEAPSRWLDALAWSSTINQQRYGGYSDWRAATREDYGTIDNPKKTRQSYRANPVGYPDAFANGGGEWYWTEKVSETGTGHIHKAYVFSFTAGGWSEERVHTDAHPLPQYAQGSIRLVRGPLPPSKLPGDK